MDRGRSPSPPSSSLLSPIRPTVPTVPTFASSSSQFLRSENSTLLQKINHHKNVSSKLQLENKQLKEKVNELTKLVDTFNSARLIATPVSSDVESFFAREEYEEVLRRETEQRIRLNDEAANKENDEKEEQKEKEQLTKVRIFNNNISNLNNQQQQQQHLIPLPLSLPHPLSSAP